ncbi:MAG: DUF2934 domain-containing protein [Nitrospira sp.]|nr:DUF2934 domain-containing protein [Nitrospira sp.]MCP9464432.1 DUF2934 domain-containing protein [Nitrospira sp.]
MRGKTKKTGSSKAKPTTAAPASTAVASVKTPAELSEDLWERIAKKAYELWEQRGRQDGNDLRDWLDAEAIVMEEIHEARE